MRSLFEAVREKQGEGEEVEVEVEVEKRDEEEKKKKGFKKRIGRPLFPSLPPIPNSLPLPLKHTKTQARTCHRGDERPQSHDRPDLDARQPPVAEEDGREREQRQRAVRGEVPALGDGERGRHG